MPNPFGGGPRFCHLEPTCYIPDKIRQQLQVLRDLKLFEFLTPGSYRLH